MKYDPSNTKKWYDENSVSDLHERARALNREGFTEAAAALLKRAEELNHWS